MKRLITTALSIALMTVVSFAGNDKTQSGRYKVNSDQSTIVWTGEKVTGFHTGSIAIQNGNISVKDGEISAADVNVDMTSITCTDLTDEGYNQKLVGHLKSADFFNVSEFNSASFTLIRFEEKKGENGENYLIHGTLTIKGITKPISFPATVVIDEDGVNAKGKMVFDRSQYDIRYGSGSFFEGLGDKMIYDNVSLDFVLVAKS